MSLRLINMALSDISLVPKTSSLSVSLSRILFTSSSRLLFIFLILSSSSSSSSAQTTQNDLQDPVLDNINIIPPQPNDVYHIWDTSITGFSPQTVTSFYLPESGQSEHYFHDVTQAPEILRGGYFVDGQQWKDRLMMTSEGDLNNNDGNGIDNNRGYFPSHNEFHVLDPEGQILPFQKYSHTEGLFQLTATVNGTYSLIMPSEQSSIPSLQSSLHKGTNTNRKLATFAFQYAPESHINQQIQPEHFDDIDKNIESLNLKIREIENEQTYLWLHQKSHLDSVRVVNMRSWWFALLQFVVVMLMTSFQIYWVRGLIDCKRVII